MATIQDIAQYRVGDTGLYAGLTDPQYRTLDYPSFSRLKAFALCLPEDKSPSRAMLAGTAAHTWLLRGVESLRAQFASVKEDYDLVSKDGKARHAEHEAANPGKIVLRAREASLVKSVVGAVNQSPLKAALAAAGENEAVCVAGLPDTEPAMAFKGMIDMVRPKARPAMICDLKTTGWPDEQSFRNAIADHGYFVQAAMYCDLYQQATGNGAAFAWLCVSVQPPHPTWIVQATPQQLAEGRFVYKTWAKLWHRYNTKKENDNVGREE